MPPMTTSGRALSFELSPGAHVFGAGRGPGMPEVEKRGARFFEALRLHDELRDRPAAMKFGKDGNACADDAAHRLASAFELDHVRAAFLDEANSGFGALWQRQIAAQERALDAAAHRLAYDEHLV